jgi:hypothetical protein
MLSHASVMALKLAVPKINYYLIVLLVLIPPIPFRYWAAVPMAAPEPGGGS